MSEHGPPTSIGIQIHPISGAGAFENSLQELGVPPLTFFIRRDILGGGAEDAFVVLSLVFATLLSRVPGLASRKAGQPSWPLAQGRSLLFSPLLGPARPASFR